METPIIMENGKPKFVGAEDPSNPPTIPYQPNFRTCTFCHAQNTNDMEQCLECGHMIDDSKMQCPVCHKWFDYLIGENENGGVQGCESCWKPAERKI
jgi:hypothetical protein